MKYLELDEQSNPVGDGDPPIGSDKPTLFVEQPGGTLGAFDRGRNAEIRVLYRFPNDNVRVAFSKFPLGHPKFDVKAGDLGELDRRPDGLIAIQWPK